jgi:hypothetical protein
VISRVNPVAMDLSACTMTDTTNIGKAKIVDVILSKGSHEPVSKGYIIRYNIKNQRNNHIITSCERIEL